MRLAQRFPLVVAAVLAGGGWTSAQVPWDLYADPVSGGACDIVNAGNLEFVVFSDTGEVVVITGEDYLLELPFVDENGVYFFGDIPLGEIVFAEDGDGFRTVWLLAPDDTVIDLDPDTGEPIFTDAFPEDFVGVLCDAFDLWDDDDFDDVPDDFDLCPETPPDEFVDEDGCACFEIDSDGDGLDDCDDECPFDFGDDAFGCPCEVFDEDDDGINDCFDECPNTPFGADVDDDGCEIVVVVPPPVFVSCGGLSSLTMISTLCGLMGLRLVSRRRPRAGSLVE